MFSSRDRRTLQERGFAVTPQYDFGPSQPAQAEIEIKVQIYFPMNERIPENAVGVISSRLKTAGVRSLVGMIRAKQFPSTPYRWVELPCQRESDAKMVLEVLKEQDWPFEITGEYRFWRN